MGYRSAALVAATVLGLAGSAGAQLIQHMPLDGDATATVGTSGTLQGTPPPQPAPDQNNTPNGALSFASTGASSGSYVDVPGGGGLNNLQTGTIAFFARWDGTQDSACCGDQHGVVVGRQSNGLFSNHIIGLNDPNPAVGTVTVNLYNAGTQTVVGTTPVGDGQWHHVALTYTSGSQQLYIDGNLDATGSAAGSINNDPAVALALGAWIGHGDSYSTSRMNDFRVYNTILSQDEIRALIPEPGSAGLVLLGLGALATSRRRRRS